MQNATADKLYEDNASIQRNYKRQPQTELCNSTTTTIVYIQSWIDVITRISYQQENRESLKAAPAGLGLWNSCSIEVRIERMHCTQLRRLDTGKSGSEAVYSEGWRSSASELLQEGNNSIKMAIHNSKTTLCYHILSLIIHCASNSLKSLCETALVSTIRRSYAWNEVVSNVFNRKYWETVTGFVFFRREQDHILSFNRSLLQIGHVQLATASNNLTKLKSKQRCAGSLPREKCEIAKNFQHLFFLTRIGEDA